MKKLIAIFVLIFILSCKVTEKPELIDIETVKVIQANKEGIKVKTDLLFLNKNSVGGTLQAKNIAVFLDSVQVATIKSEEFKVPKKDTFTMPLLVTVPYGKVFKDKQQNLLSGIMNMLQNKKITLKYVGKIRYSLGAFHYDYPLDTKQEFTLK